MKNLCSYYKIYEVDYEYLLRDLCDYGYPLKTIFLCSFIKKLLHILIIKIERFDDL